MMHLNQVKKEMQRLSAEFKKHEPSLYGMQIGEIKQNEELMTLFASLYYLMQNPLFYEVVLTDGFAKITSDDTNIWGFISPIMSLVGSFYKIFCGLFSEHYVYNWGYDFSCQEKEWLGSTAKVDFHLSKWLVEQCNNELFLGTHEIYLHDQAHKKNYENIIKKLMEHSSHKATVLLEVYDGQYTEPLFFIRDEEQLEVLVATNSWGKASHLHKFTQELIDKYKIKCTVSPKIKVIHDGNCSIHSELNINTVLYKALLQNNSVYRIIDALRKEELSLSDSYVHFSDVVPNNNSHDKPDFSTLTRLLTNAASVFLLLGGSGWIDFCSTRAIHPKNIVKTSYREWSAIQYPNWLSTEVFFQEEVMATISRSQSDIDLCLITRNYIEKLADCGALGAQVLQQIKRLQLHQDSCNPYWINSKEKAEAIITALDNLDLTEEVTLRDAVTDSKSELYNALNISRLSPLTFLGIWGWNQAKSLQYVQEVAQSVSLKT